MRLLKQLIYGLFFLAIFVGIVWIIYISAFSSPPSCFDGKRNQGETGVDCGGPCVPCEIKNLEEIKVNSAKIFNLDNGTGIVVEIQNPNVGWGAKRFDYRLDIKNSLGETIYTQNGRSYIYAGELKYLVFPKINVPEKDVADISLFISKVDWVEDRFFKKPNIEVLDVRTNKEDNEFLNVSGRLENRDEIDYSPVYVSALLYSHSGKLLAASKTRIDQLNKFDSENFVVIFPGNLVLYNPSLDFSSYFPKDLKFGDSGDEVKNLQLFLAESGILPRDPTGFYDKATESAVKILQKTFGLEETGEFNNETRTKLINELSVGAIKTFKGQEETAVDATLTKVFVEALREAD